MRQAIQIKIFYLVKTNILKFICCLHKTLFPGKLLKNFAAVPTVAYYKLVSYFVDAVNCRKDIICLFGQRDLAAEH